MKYLSPQDVLMIHARILDTTGGAHGVRDINQIASLIARPKMRFARKNLYPTIFDKAAAYIESCALFHPFVDGNKRTAIVIAVRFLYINGYTFHASSSEIERFVIDFVKKKYEFRDAVTWLRKHSSKL